MKTVHVPVSEMPRQIPAGALVELDPVRIDNLKFGDIVYVDLKDRKGLCRYLRGWSSNGDPMVMLAQPGFSQAIVLPFKALVGKVGRVSHEGKVTEPNLESPLLRLLPRLTQYGTKKFF